MLKERGKLLKAGRKDSYVELAKATGLWGGRCALCLCSAEKKLIEFQGLFCFFQMGLGEVKHLNEAVGKFGHRFCRSLSNYFVALDIFRINYIHFDRCHNVNATVMSIKSDFNFLFVPT